MPTHKARRNRRAVEVSLRLAGTVVVLRHLRARRRKRRALTVGPSPRADVCVALPAHGRGGAVPFVIADAGGGFTIGAPFADRGRGALTAPDGFVWRLSPQLELRAREVTLAAPIPRGAVPRPRFSPAWAGSLGAHLLLLGLAWLVPPSRLAPPQHEDQVRVGFAGNGRAAGPYGGARPPAWLTPTSTSAGAGERPGDHVGLRLRARPRRAAERRGPAVSSTGAVVVDPRQLAQRAVAGLVGAGGGGARGSADPAAAEHALGTAAAAMAGLTARAAGQHYGIGGLGLSGFGVGCDDGPAGRGGCTGLGGMLVGSAALGRGATRPLAGDLPGDGLGRGLGRAGRVPPRVIICGASRRGCASVRGALDKAIVRRVVRAHVNEVRYCYARGLQRRPELSGRVVARFVIAPGGEVASSQIEESTVGDVELEECIARAVRRWRFPTGHVPGIVIVSYPFVLMPAGGA